MDRGGAPAWRLVAGPGLRTLLDRENVEAISPERLSLRVVQLPKLLDLLLRAEDIEHGGRFENSKKRKTSEKVGLTRPSVYQRNWFLRGTLHESGRTPPSYVASERTRCG